MNELASLEMKFSDADAAPTGGPVHCRGVTIEHVKLQTTEPYEFAVTGKSHYLALHDLVLEEGEMQIDGGTAIPGGDLRGKLTYLPPNSPVSGWARPRDRQNSFTAVHFDPELMSNELEVAYRSRELKPEIYFQDVSLQVSLEKLGRMILEGLAMADIYGESLAMSAALELLHFRDRAARSAAPKSGGLGRHQERLVSEFIEQHYLTDISLEALAELAGLSRFHFTRAFKATFGRPPHRYVTERRIAAARQMLASTTMPIAQVAVASGFNSIASFIRAFREVTGTTPRDYRKSF